MDGGKIATETFPVEARDHSEVRCLRQIQRITDRYDRSRQFKFLGFTNWQGRRRLIHFQNCCPAADVCHELARRILLTAEFDCEIAGFAPDRVRRVKCSRGTAILKVDETTPALPIGKSEELELATPVISIGYPLDLPKTPNFGMIAGFDRKCLGRYFSTIHLRVNAPTQRGEAGAPLLNMKGEVVGIVVSGLENNSACYAVPIESAEKIRSDFVRFGEARHGWIGVNNVSPASQQVDGSRAMVTQVAEDTPAARSGLKEGDVLLQVGNKKISDPEDVFDASFYISAGDVVPITVMRGDQKMIFHVHATMHPASHTGVLLASPGTIPGVLPMSLDEDVTPSP